MELQERRLEVIIEQAYIKGFKHCATIMGVMKPYMSKSEAYKTYGRAKVDWWIKTGILQEQKDGDLTSKVRILRSEIEDVAARSNRGI